MYYNLLQLVFDKGRNYFLKIHVNITNIQLKTHNLVLKGYKETNLLASMFLVAFLQQHN